MNAKISVFSICVEVIIYSLLYNLHDCNFKSETNEILEKSNYSPNFCRDGYSGNTTLEVKQCKGLMNMQ